MIGIGYLESGQLEKAITAHERIRKYAPKNTIYLPIHLIDHAVFYFLASEQ